MYLAGMDGLARLDDPDPYRQRLEPEVVRHLLKLLDEQQQRLARRIVSELAHALKK